MAMVDTRTPKQKMVAQRKKAFQKYFVDRVLAHEDLAPFQLPFRLPEKASRPKARVAMAKWVSMFDDLGDDKLLLDPAFEKEEGRENFLYTTKQEDVPRGVNIQFNRYAKHKNFKSWRDGYDGDPTIADAITLFDQTGANDKISFLEEADIDTNTKLKELY